MYGKVYKITNIINNKVYIGITTLEDVIKNRYCGSLKNTHNTHLRNSIKKYGEENFETNIIYEAESKEELLEKEKEYIKSYNCMNENYGYNMCAGGEGVHEYVTPDYIKQKISKNSLRVWNEYPEYRKQMSERNKGKNNPLVKKGGHSQESKAKMSSSKKRLIAEGKNIIRQSFGSISNSSSTT